MKIEDYLKELNNDKVDTFFTRQETADFLKISLTSLWSWTKLGIVKSYSLGNRRYYNKKEIIDYLKQHSLGK